MSAVVAAGTTTTDDLTTTTDLAARLAMPPTPFAREPNLQIGIGCGCFFLAFVALLIFGITTLNTGIIYYVFLILNAVWIGWVVFCAARHLAQQRIASHNRRSWPSVKRRWDDLDYCQRDDLVFSRSDPSRNALSAQMQALLFADLDLV